MINIFFEFFSFIVFVVFGLYVPGIYFLKRLRLTLEFPVNIFLPFGLGIFLYTFLSYILAWVKLDISIIPILLLINFFAVKGRISFPFIERIHVKPLFFVVLISIIFALPMFSIGQFGDTIIYQRDDLWHLALINELKNHFPPDNPGVANISLKGYHFFYNFLIAKISNIFFISPLSLHFHLFPVFVSLLWGFGVYALIFRWSKNMRSSLWAVFLTMFGGSFAFILQLQGHKGFSWDAGFGINQPFGLIINPPFSISIVLLVTILLIMYEYTQTRKANWFIPLSLCVGFIAMFKVYAGMIAIGGFLFLLVYELIRKRWWVIFSFVGFVLLFFSTFWYFAGSSGKLIWYPLWPLQRILETFTWYGYDEKMYTYTRFHVIRGILQTELDGLRVFILGNLGTRLFGLIFALIFLIKTKKFPSLFASIIIFMAIISLLVPMFFIQSGKVFEIIQMADYFLFFCAFFAAFGFSFIFSLNFSKFIKGILFLLIILITLPPAYVGLVNLYHLRIQKNQSISTPYFQAMRFLYNQQNYNATVLEIPSKNTNSTDKEIFLWYTNSNPGIAAFTNKRSFFNSEFIDFPSINVGYRLNVLKDMLIFRDTSVKDIAFPNVKEKIINDLKSNDIHFIFSSYEIPALTRIPKIRKSYENGQFVIYSVIL